jgi:hypothetical protein
VFKPTFAILQLDRGVKKYTLIITSTMWLNKFVRFNQGIDVGLFSFIRASI